jgi:iron complex outermembrane recepter protein
MKKVLVLLVALFAMPLGLLAQYTLSGDVRSSETNELLSGASVRLLNAGRGQASDASGSFRFTNLQAGTYTLKITYVGHKALEQQVILAADQHLQLQLQNDGLLAEEVIVTATRASEQTPTTFTQVSREELQKQNLGQDIPFLLNFTPSVVVTSDAGAGVGYTGLRIRGSDATRINVTVNGIPMNDAESHGTFWVNTPDLASSVDNIQIQRGVGTSTNGAAAFGASLNIQTERLNPEPYGEVQLGAGSFNTQRYTLKAGTGLLKNHFAIDARLSKISSDGYIDRSFSDLRSFFVSGGYYDDKTLLKVNVFSGREHTYQAWYGTPEAVVRGDQDGIEAYIARNWISDPEQLRNLRTAGRTYNYYTYENETDNYQQDHYQLIFGRDLSSNLQLNLAGHYTRGRGYYEQFRRNDRLSNYGLEPIVMGETTISRTDLVRQRWLDNHFGGFTYSLNWEPTSTLKLVWGGGWNQYDGDHFGEIIWARYAGTSNLGDRYYDNNAVKTDFNSFLKGYYALTPQLDLYGDIQYRTIDYRFGGLNNDRTLIEGDYTYHFLNPKGGLSYRLSPGNRLYASYAIAHREPVRRDFTDAPMHAEGLGRAIPKPEVLRNLEIGYEARLSRQLQLGANYYLMDYKDQLVLTGEINDVGSSIRINVPESYRTGVELQGIYSPLQLLKLEANATLSRNRIRRFDDVLVNYDSDQLVRTEIRNSPIAFSPNLIANGILSLYPMRQLELSLLSKYVSRQYLDNTGTDSRSLDAYWVNDLRANWSLRPRFVEEIRLNLLVNNIFNTLYSSNGYTFGYIAGDQTIHEVFLYPQAGTNFLIGATVRF